MIKYSKSFVHLQTTNVEFLESVILYVDDTLVEVKGETRKIKTHLCKDFEMKNLGIKKIFWGGDSRRWGHLKKIFYKFNLHFQTHWDMLYSLSIFRFLLCFQLVDI